MDTLVQTRMIRPSTTFVEVKGFINREWLVEVDALQTAKAFDHQGGSCMRHVFAMTPSCATSVRNDVILKVSVYEQLAAYWPNVSAAVSA